MVRERRFHTRVLKLRRFESKAVRQAVTHGARVGDPVRPAQISERFVSRTRHIILISLH